MKTLALAIIAAYRAIPARTRDRRFGSNGASTAARRAILAGAPPLRVLWAYGRPNSVVTLLLKVVLGHKLDVKHDWGFRPPHTARRPAEWNLWTMSVNTDLDWLDPPRRF